MSTGLARDNASSPLRPIDEQPALLDSMVSDSRATGKYAPGPYGRGKTLAAVREIKRHGLADFRGDTSGAGTSFADNAIVDIRPTLGTSLRGLALQFVLERVWPFSLVMNQQVDLTRGWLRDALSLAGQSLRNSAETQDLLARYSMPESRLGGCVATVEIGGEEIAIHYLQRHCGRWRALVLVSGSGCPSDAIVDAFQVSGEPGSRTSTAGLGTAKP